MMNQRVRIRTAHHSDARFIEDLSRDVFSLYGPYGEAVLRWFRNKNTVTLVATEDEMPVGFAMIGPRSKMWALENTSELLAIGIIPDRQKRGVGKRLAGEIEKTAIRLNIKRLFLHTASENYIALELFRKVGYRPWGMTKNFYPEGQDAVVMSKSIGLTQR